MDSDRPANRLTTLGPSDLRRSDGSAVRSVLAQPKRVALLAYLRLANDGTPVSRDELLGTFWPEIPEDRALNALRQAVHFLRRSLEAGIVERTGDHLLHVPPERLWCDVAELARLVEAGRPEEAVELAGGRFLDGLRVDGSHALEDWIDQTRRRTDGLVARALADLCDAALAEDRLIEAADWARRLVDLDPLDERGASMLVDAHLTAGDPVSAVRVYDAYAERLARELCVQPSAELAARVAEIRGATPMSSPEAPATPDPIDEASGADPAPADPPAGPPGGSRPAKGMTAVRRAGSARRLALALGGAAGLTLVALAIRTFVDADGRGNEGETPPWIARPSIAVLPFENLSPDSANAFFAAGVHESLHASLSSIGGIEVSALRAVRAYADTDLASSEIADRLDVTSIMTGSVQREGDAIRIIVELGDPATGAQIWADTYDRELNDVFAVQSEIARSVARSLETVLTADEADRIARPLTDDLDALDAYMRGQAAYRDVSLAGMELAIDHFGRAIELDPEFAAARAGLADALLQRVQFFGYPLTWADSALGLVEQAIDLDPGLPEAWKTLGFVHSIHGREQASLEANERALALRPGYADPLNNAGWSRYFLGDLVGAERAISRSFRLQPNILQLRSNVGAIRAALGRLDEAGRWLDGVLETSPGMTPARTWRTFVDIQRGDPEAALERAEDYLSSEAAEAPALARAAFSALLARDPERAVRHAGRAIEEAPGVDLFDLRRIETIHGFALIATGRQEAGERAVRAGIEAVNRKVANGGDGWDPPWEWAAAYAALGDREEALRHLTRAVDAGFPHSILLRLDPTFDGLRGHPEFERLVAAVEAREGAQLEESRNVSGS